MAKLNCWEFKKCGRQEGGDNEEELGKCPVFKTHNLDGVHSGQAAGRACWVVAGTMCKDKPSGTFAQKMYDCRQCDFYRLVKKEEGDEFMYTIVLLARVESKSDW